jgi:hypothetical protein
MARVRGTASTASACGRPTVSQEKEERKKEKRKENGKNERKKKEKVKERQYKKENLNKMKHEITNVLWNWKIINRNFWKGERTRHGIRRAKERINVGQEAGKEEAWGEEEKHRTTRKKAKKNHSKEWQGGKRRGMMGDWETPRRVERDWEEAQLRNKQRRTSVAHTIRFWNANSRKEHNIDPLRKQLHFFC